MRAHLAGLKRAGLDLLFPPDMLDAEAAAMPRPQTVGLSAAAWSAVRFVDAPVCEPCGAPFPHALGPGALCLACTARRPVYARARAACLYDEHSRDLILKLKHADRTDLAPLFAGWLARAAGPLLREAQAVVPVPLHRGRLLGRRYNQAAEVARPLARRFALPYWPGALVRARDTGGQAGRSGAGRRRAVQGAFKTPEPWRSRVAGRRILLVDDVLTTGATAESCARALLSAGAAAVDVAVIAKTPERAA